MCSGFYWVTLFVARGVLMLTIHDSPKRHKEADPFVFYHSEESVTETFVNCFVSPGLLRYRTVCVGKEPFGGNSLVSNT